MFTNLIYRWVDVYEVGVLGRMIDHFKAKFWGPAWNWETSTVAKRSLSVPITAAAFPIAEVQRPQIFSRPELQHLQAHVTSEPIEDQQNRRLEYLLTVRKGAFPGAINGYGDYIAMVNAYEALSSKYLLQDRPSNTADDFPENDVEAQKALVSELFYAVVDCSQTIEQSTAVGVRRLKEGKYSDIEIEMMCWEVLFAARDAQKGELRMRACAADWRYENYNSFADRWQQVVLGLTVWNLPFCISVRADD